VGLYLVALRIGHSLEELRAAKAHLEAHGVEELRLRDHTVSQSIYLNDPDGNGLELYVDADPGIWRKDPRRWRPRFRWISESPRCLHWRPRTSLSIGMSVS
jgi:catechol-2,3-dioxygenase